MRRFLRDLCTFPELEALTHRWQTVLLLDQGLPYVEIAERVPTSTATVTRVARWLRHGAGATGLHSNAPGAEGVGGDDRALHAGGRERTADARGSREGADGRAGTAPVRRCGALVRGDRALARRSVRERSVDLLLVRPSDIPEYAQDGVVDLGITGANLVVEADVDVVTLAELGFARCSLEAAVPVDAPQREVVDLVGLRVATAYPVSTRRLLEEAGVDCELVPVSGSVEATPRLGLADAIVDLVSTGSTMSANGPSDRQAAVLAGRARRWSCRDRGATRPRRPARADALGRGRRPTSALPDDERARRRPPGDSRRAPGMGAPSVLQLAEEGEIAVHAAVDADEVWTLLPVLREVGATSILVLPIELVP